MLRFRIKSLWISLRIFADIIGCEGYDGRPLTVRDAWQIAFAGWRW